MTITHAIYRGVQFVPMMEFDLFEVLEAHVDKDSANVGVRWLLSTATKERGPNKEFVVRRLLCQSYGNKTDLTI